MISLSFVRLVQNGPRLHAATTRIVSTNVLVSSLSTTRLRSAALQQAMAPQKARSAAKLEAEPQQATAAQQHGQVSVAEVARPRSGRQAKRSSSCGSAAKVVTVPAAAAAGGQASDVLFEYGQLVPGKLVQRYKRFLADVVMATSSSDDSDEPAQDVQLAIASAAATTAEVPAGKAVEGMPPALVVHCPNTGPMTGLLDWPMADVWCSVSGTKGRKYAHTLEMIQAGGPGAPWVGVHSAQANKLALQLLLRRQLPQLGDYVSLQQEVAYGSQGSRVDFVLTRPSGARLFVEVKSVTLAEPYAPSGGGAHSSAAVPATGAAQERGRGGRRGAKAARKSPDKPAMNQAAAASQQQQGDGSTIALFPDTVSLRAQRHMQELMGVVATGDEAACLFLIQRSDCSRFAPCHAKDPAYGQLVLQAAAAGVQIVAVACGLEPQAAGGLVRLLGPVEIELQYGCAADS